MVLLWGLCSWVENPKSNWTDACGDPINPYVTIKITNLLSSTVSLWSIGVLWRKIAVAVYVCVWVWARATLFVYMFNPPPIDTGRSERHTAIMHEECLQGTGTDCECVHLCVGAEGGHQTPCSAMRTHCPRHTSHLCTFLVQFKEINTIGRNQLTCCRFTRLCCCPRLH